MAKVAVLYTGPDTSGKAVPLVTRNDEAGIKLEGDPLRVGPKKLKSRGIHDKITSIEVEPGWKVSVYEHAGQKGTSKTLTGPRTYGWFRRATVELVLNNAISSITAEKLSAQEQAKETAKQALLDESGDPRPVAVAGAAGVFLLVFFWFLSLIS